MLIGLKGAIKEIERERRMPQRGKSPLPSPWSLSSIVAIAARVSFPCVIG